MYIILKFTYPIQISLAIYLQKIHSNIRIYTGDNGELHKSEREKKLIQYYQMLYSLSYFSFTLFLFLKVSISVFIT